MPLNNLTADTTTPLKVSKTIVFNPKNDRFNLSTYSKKKGNSYDFSCRAAIQRGSKVRYRDKLCLPSIQKHHFFDQMRIESLDKWRIQNLGVQRLMQSRTEWILFRKPSKAVFMESIPRAVGFSQNKTLVT